MTYITIKITFRFELYHLLDGTPILCRLRRTDIRSIFAGSGRLHMAWFMSALLCVPVAVGPTTVVLSARTASLLQNRLRKVSINVV